MTRLPASLSAWGASGFEDTFKREVEALGIEGLPLQHYVSAGSYVLPLPITAILLGTEECNGTLCIRAGIFFKSTIAGCSCADDPSPPNELDEYCELRFEIDPSTATTLIVHAED